MLLGPVMTQLSDVYGTAHDLSKGTWLAILANAGRSGFVDFDVDADGSFDLQRKTLENLIVIECDAHGKVRDASITTEKVTTHTELFRRDPIEVLLWLAEVLP
jgi:hypothetical protein